MKKKVLSVLLAATMLLGLTACGGEAEKKDEKVTLKWAIWDEATTQYWGDLKAAYEAANHLLLAQTGAKGCRVRR